MNLVIIAHNIRSAYNIGAIFRAADGMGAKKIYLTGYSACPRLLRNSVAGISAGDVKKNTVDSHYLLPHEKMIAKTALGAENNIL